MNLLSTASFWIGLGQIALGVLGMIFGFLTQDAGIALVVTGVTAIAVRTQTSTPASISAPAGGFVPSRGFRF